MKKLSTYILITLLLATSAFADLGVSVYTGVAGSGKATQAGTVYVNFALVGFTGSIGGATFSNVTANFPIMSGYQGGVGQRMNAIAYTVSSGSLFIVEVK